jgi:hypothetical protein
MDIKYESCQPPKLLSKKEYSNEILTLLQLHNNVYHDCIKTFDRLKKIINRYITLNNDIIKMIDKYDFDT